MKTGVVFDEVICSMHLILFDFIYVNKLENKFTFIDYSKPLTPRDILMRKEFQLIDYNKFFKVIKSDTLLMNKFNNFIIENLDIYRKLTTIGKDLEGLSIFKKDIELIYSSDLEFFFINKMIESSGMIIGVIDFQILLYNLYHNHELLDEIYVSSPNMLSQLSFYVDKIKVYLGLSNYNLKSPEGITKFIMRRI